MLFIQLGDIYKSRELPLVQVFPRLFRANTDAVLCGNHNNAGIHYTNRLHHFAGKVKITGVIKEIDLCTTKLNGDNGGRDRILPLNLLRVKIADRCAIGRLSEAVGSLGVEQHAFRQSGLSVATVSDQADVANVERSIAHIDLPLSDPEYRLDRPWILQFSIG